jgi:hypothetical protein
MVDVPKEVKRYSNCRLYKYKNEVKKLVTPVDIHLMNLLYGIFLSPKYRPAESRRCEHLMPEIPHEMTFR